jgi:hypothetical protein
LSSARLLAKDSNSPKPPVNVVTREPAKASLHNPFSITAYARVSTYGQTLDSQLEQLRKAGCNGRNIYREKVTGARADRSMPAALITFNTGE